MQKYTAIKVWSGIISGCIVVGELLITTLLPSSGWVSDSQAKLGTVVGAILLVICVPISIILWVRAFRLQKSAELEDIKSKLIDMNSYQRVAAHKKIKQE